MALRPNLSIGLPLFLQIDNRDYRPLWTGNFIGMIADNFSIFRTLYPKLVLKKDKWLTLHMIISIVLAC